MRLLKSLIVGGLALLSGQFFSSSPVSQNSFVQAAHLQYTGVNEAGLDFGYSVQGAGSGPSSCPPTSASFSFMKSNNMNTIRLNFRWERVQPTLNGALDPTEWGKVTTSVTNALNSGISYILLDVHNYAQYGANIIGSSAVPISAFADLWRRIATVYAGNPAILFGLMNEPVGSTSFGQSQTLTGAVWLQAVNAAIAAIRGVQNANNLITVPGLGYTGAHDWAQNAGYGTPNSQTFASGAVVDPGNNYVFEVHQYFDVGTGYAGTSTPCTDVVSQMTDIVTFSKATGKKIFLGEFGGGGSTTDNPTCQTAVTNLLNFLEANTDVFIGWTWWAAGPCWGNYIFSVEPGISATTNPQINWLAPFGAFAGTNGNTPTTAANNNPTTSANPTVPYALTIYSSPATATVGTPFTVQLQYSAPVDSEIVVNILSLPNYGYVTGANTLVTAGSGTINPQLTIPAGTAAGTSYTFDVFIVAATTYNANPNNAYLSAAIDKKVAVSIVTANTNPTSATPTSANPTTATVVATTAAATTATPTTAAVVPGGTIPNINFKSLLESFTVAGTSWCTTCAAFSTNCAMGCAGDTGGGGPCPANACPRVFTFTNDANNDPIWNINIATAGSPYRAFSYIPLCTTAGSCTAPFVFSFSFMYIPPAGAPATAFGTTQDYLKLLFWGDGNNIIGIKNGLLLGLPGNGNSDLVGSSAATFSGFSYPLQANTWINVAVTFTYGTGNPVQLAFAVNGAPIGSTTGTIGSATSGLQFGAYVWGNTFFQLQYKDIAISAVGANPQPSTNKPTTAVTVPTTATNPTTAPTTIKPTTAANPTTVNPTTAKPTTANPTTATPTTQITPGNTPTGTITINFSNNGGAFTPQCSNGAWALFGLTMTATVSVQVFGSNKVVTNQPMAETVQDSVTGNFVVINMNFFINGVPTTVTVPSTFNVANSMATGNTWSFALQDDQGTPGGTILLGSCTQGQAAPIITASFSTTSFIHATGAPPNIPAVNALPTIVNNLAPVNREMGGGVVPTLPPTTPKPPTTQAGATTTKAPTTQPVVVTTTAPVATTAATNAPTTQGGFIKISVTGPAYAPRCGASGQWFLDGYSWTFSTESSNGVLDVTNPPMNENGACTEQLTAYWYLNGQPAPLAVNSPFNFGAPTTLGVDAVAGPPLVNGNTMIFNLQDNMATPGATFVLTPPTPCTQGSPAPTISTAFTIANFVIMAPGNGGSIPAVNAIPTVINNLPVANRATVGGGTIAPTWAPPPATSAPPTTQPVPTTSATGTTGTYSYVITIGADPTQNGGHGINAIQCNNGWLQATVNLLVSININNIHAYQPMAELGLATINMVVWLNGAPGNVNVINSFNVATSSSLGNIWTFTLNDDGPHPGGQMILGMCKNNVVPQVQVSFFTNSIVTVAGLPNGADGGPPVPALNNVVPTIVNALPANLNAGGAIPQNQPTTTVPPVVTTTATPPGTPTTAPVTTTTGATTGSITIVLSASAYQPQCNGQGQWMLFFQGYNVAVTTSNGGQTATHAPMDENGAPQTTINGAFYLDGTPAKLAVTSPTNIANSQVAGNVWSFTLQDDQPVIGAAFALTPATPCNFASTIPRITSFFSTNSFVVAPGGNGNIAVSAVPTVVNNLQPANLATSTGGPSGKVTVPPPTNIPTTATPTTAAGATTNTPTTNNGNAINQVILTQIQKTGYCTGAFLTVSVGLQISQNGMQPMAENGLPTVTASVFQNGNPVKIISLVAYNAVPTLSGNTFTFTETDDMPSVGGQLTLNIPCSYAVTPNPTATGISISYSASNVQINGANTVVAINNVAQQQDQLPMPAGTSVTVMNTNNDNNNNNTTVIVAVVVVIGVVLIIVVASILIYRSRRQAKRDATNTQMAMSNAV